MPVGKTTLAKDILRDQSGYLNWDIAEDRERILRRELPPAPLLVFDEIHKYRNWRNYLKGLYDRSPRDSQILVTGSARLDYYRHGGDSLQGRYHYLRLFPLSCAELGITTTADMQELLHLGGFPEPFFASSEVESRRWSREYRRRLIEEDLASLERVHDLGTLELLLLRLPDLVGSPLSINAQREDLQAAHKTVANWLRILERLYAIFRLSPFGAPRIRAVKKEQKHYHFDWTLVKEPGARFENMVALHLLKWTAFREDTLGLDVELRYFRDIDGREVDFVLLEDGKPTTLVECKTGGGPPGKGLKYLRARFPHCRALQISAADDRDFVTPEGIRVMPAPAFLAELV
ncbi:ATP-binding protein [Desulfurivibrio sp. D14AmB]|uniref:ATP-binding protein n=1 Tax=Desulfurivibrio sp. D14AmB TaxID=3374370 RepID=UPI00376ECB43